MTISQQKPQLTSDQSINRKRFKTALAGFYGGFGNDSLALSMSLEFFSTIAADVSDELVKHEDQLGLITNAHRLPIAVNETAKSLLAKVTQPSHHIHTAIGSVIAAAGIGQRNGLAEISAREQLKGQEFSQLMKRVRTESTQANGGAVDTITCFSFVSLAGGCGSGVVTPISEAIQKYLSTHDEPTHLSIQATCSVSFAGLGDSVDVNCVSALDNLLELVKSTNQKYGSKKVASLRVSSLPPVERDNASRAELNLLEKQAWFSEEVQAWQQIVWPNTALAGEYGNISFTSCEYFTSLSQELICNEIAMTYCNEIHLELGNVRPALYLVQQVDMNQSTEAINRPTIDDLVAKSDALLFDEFKDGVQCVGFRYDFDITISDIDGRSFECERIADYFSTSAPTLRSAIHDLTLVATIKEQLGIEYEEAVQSQRELEDEKEKLLQILRKHYARRARTTRARQKRYCLLKATASKLRVTSDDLRRTVKLSAELNKCLSLATAQLERQIAVPRAIAKVLSNHCLPLNRKEEGAFYFRRTNDAYGDLMPLLTVNKKLQGQLIASNATSITEDGLKTVLSTESADPKLLAARAVDTPDTPGAWMAAVRRRPTETTIVFPPMSSSLAQGIKKEIAKLRPSWHVFFSDSCKLGINVVRINIYYPETLDDCFPGYFRTIREEIKTSRLRVLHQPYSEMMEG